MKCLEVTGINNDSGTITCMKLSIQFVFWEQSTIVQNLRFISSFNFFPISHLSSCSSSHKYARSHELGEHRPHIDPPTWTLIRKSQNPSHPTIANASIDEQRNLQTIRNDSQKHVISTIWSVVLLVCSNNSAILEMAKTEYEHSSQTLRVHFDNDCLYSR